MILSCPSKTFLVGEYAVLAGGPALLVNTSPRFELRAVKGSGRIDGIPEGSPAFRLLQENPRPAKLDLIFSDPHEGAGGFGASGAQFLFAHAVARDHHELAECLADYRRVDQGSGSDILSQAVGQVAQLENGAAEARAWPFPDLDFAVIRTGHKIATHDHLRDLDPGKSRELVPFAQETVAAFMRRDEERFIGSLREYGEALTARGLQAEATLSLLAKALRVRGVLAAKGCGALGADTVLLLVRAADLGEARKFARAQGLPFVASRADLNEGFKMERSS